MASDLNVIAMVGRLTRPADLKYTNSGYAILSFSIAVNRRKKQQDGTWQDQASFFDCTYFGKAAEGVSQYLQKGQQVSIQGSLEQQSWQKDGQNRSKVVIIVDSLGLIGSSQNQQNSGYSQQPQQRQQSNSYQQQNQAQGQYSRPQQASQMVKQPVAPENFEDDSDIPF